MKENAFKLPSVIKRTECLLFTYKTLWNLQWTLYAFENQLWTEVHIIICWKWIVMGSHPATQTAQFLPILLCPLGSMCSSEFGWLNHFFATSTFLDKLYKWYWFMPGMLEEIKSGYYKYWSQWQWHANVSQQVVNGFHKHITSCTIGVLTLVLIIQTMRFFLFYISLWIQGSTLCLSTYDKTHNLHNLSLNTFCNIY